jgi:Arc/MetJ-type ribon-helix-helix transcriptional regulator
VADRRLAPWLYWAVVSIEEVYGMTTQLTIVLPAQAQAYVDEQLAKGLYATVDELIVDLILREQTRQVHQLFETAIPQDCNVGEADECDVNEGAVQERDQWKIDRSIAPNWIDRLAGSISNNELFLEALQSRCT